MIQVEIEPSCGPPKKIVMPKAADVEKLMPSGLDLVKRIYEAQLSAYDQRIKSAKELDNDTIKSVKDIASTLIDIEKADRDRARADKWTKQLEGMTDEELWDLLNSKKK